MESLKKNTMNYKWKRKKKVKGFYVFSVSFWTWFSQREWNL